MAWLVEESARSGGGGARAKVQGRRGRGVFLIFKGLLESEQRKQHMVIIGVYKSLSNSDFYKHRCPENIKKIYKSAGNVIINSSTRQLLKTPWYLLLRYLLTTVQCHLYHM